MMLGAAATTDVTVARNRTVVGGVLISAPRLQLSVEHLPKNKTATNWTMDMGMFSSAHRLVL